MIIKGSNISRNLRLVPFGDLRRNVEKSLFHLSPSPLTSLRHFVEFHRAMRLSSTHRYEQNWIVITLSILTYRIHLQRVSSLPLNPLYKVFGDFAAGTRTLEWDAYWSLLGRTDRESELVLMHWECHPAFGPATKRLDKVSRQINCLLFFRRFPLQPQTL